MQFLFSPYTLALFSKTMLWKYVVAATIGMLVFEIKVSSGQRKRSDDGKSSSEDGNYIITHYGTERYTPVSEDAMQMYKTGFYKAEVIPVDPNTGLEIGTQNEWKPVNNVYVPLRTGYSVNEGNSAFKNNGPPIAETGASFSVSSEVDDTLRVLTPLSNNEDFRLINVSSSMNIVGKGNDDKRVLVKNDKSKRKKYKTKQIFGFTNKPIKENIYYDTTADYSYDARKAPITESAKGTSQIYQNRENRKRHAAVPRDMEFSNLFFRNTDSSYDDRLFQPIFDWNRQ